jgi:hypothetical protein
MLKLCAAIATFFTTHTVPANELTIAGGTSIQKTVVTRFATYVYLAQSLHANKQAMRTALVSTALEQWLGALTGDDKARITKQYEVAQAALASQENWKALELFLTITEPMTLALRQADCGKPNLSKMPYYVVWTMKNKVADLPVLKVAANAELRTAVLRTIDEREGDCVSEVSKAACSFDIECEPAARRPLPAARRPLARRPGAEARRARAPAGSPACSARRR